jgi:hypothetical protein
MSKDDDVRKIAEIIVEKLRKSKVIRTNTVDDLKQALLDFAIRIANEGTGRLATDGELQAMVEIAKMFTEY